MGRKVVWVMTRGGTCSAGKVDDNGGSGVPVDGGSREECVYGFCGEARFED
jgi:hypothetical protein